MLEDSVDSQSLSSSDSSSDHIEYVDCNKFGTATRRPVRSQIKRAKACGDNVEGAERSSHTTVTHSPADASPADVSRPVSSDIREGALSLMKLRYPDEDMPEGRQTESNGLKHSRHAEKF
eukprot:TRINITY_DN349_c0_g1_i10.p2 TRINITY_DN349_c0_g1~~TRINITY_DN349_c0_g1_i10.p2  ORF type:complete len:120 (+),score=21.94 TRINITY_DN349_c0_g1_i10:412-771(+)